MQKCMIRTFCFDDVSIGNMGGEMLENIVFMVFILRGFIAGYLLKNNTASVNVTPGLDYNGISTIPQINLKNKVKPHLPNRNSF